MRYRLLGKSGLRVSEVGLGTMTFGEAWGWGASRAESHHIFDAFLDAGGNLIDSSINYTDGESEEYIGDCLTGRRQRLVVATKYSLSTHKDDPNAGGNHRKNMIHSLETSLRRLKTDYIDLYYLHMWDGTTPIDEIMRALDDLVRAGKILYAGISDTPAWIVAQGNTLAELMGWTRFVALQLPYSLATRDAERDLLPMARALDLAVIAWDILDGGILTGKYTSSGTEPRRYSETTISPRQRTLAAAVVDIAAELGCTPAQAAIAWVRGRPDRIIPLIGARTAAQLVENLTALTIDIPPEHRQRLDEISLPTLGFPHDFLASDHVHGLIFGDTYPLLDNHRNMAGVG